MNGELLFFGSLVKSFLVKNDFISVNQMFFKFVGKNSFNGVYFISLTNFSDQGGNLIVVVSWLDQSQSSLFGFISS